MDGPKKRLSVDAPPASCPLCQRFLAKRPFNTDYTNTFNVLQLTLHVTFELIRDIIAEWIYSERWKSTISEVFFLFSC